jgi:glycosyltransferase involved in cell wall biosynthesis
MPEAPTGLLVFADDWGRHPSSCQHLIRCLLDHRPVYWVNTIGTRRPHLDRATLLRGLEKVRDWVRGGGASGTGAANPRVVNPTMWPWMRSSLDRRLNRLLLGRQLTALIRSLSAPPVAVTTIPIVADLIGTLPVRHWVYYCVDDFGQWPGLDQEPLRRMEEVLVQRADVLIAAGDNLQERLARMGRSSHLLTHGVDLDHWRRDAAGAPLPELERLEKPLVVFWGLIDRRMDTAFVRQLSADLTAGTVVFVGPEAEPDPGLYDLARVVRLGYFHYEQLPRLAQACDVLIMPYADLPVTRAMQPLKLKEYLATGKPAVVRDLPANRPWADCLDLTDTPEAFSAAVRRRLREGLPEGQRRARLRLAEESWSAKARAFERWALRIR